MTKETAHQGFINETEWRKPGNWTGFLGLYSSPRDSRTFVPNHTKALGYVPNMAHLAGKLYVAAILLFLLGWPVYSILKRAFGG